ncbi:hypothetical protein Pint_10543 [Pistacia integerrima]|uniref:Uncharacterized protein n=1 Tax=Pistacia integerrima TaxID=434235 RepID=A0ACC0XML1_9ROSI|nr:hypothetical protein Pint_10543 [Pistacia integerrima]
MIYRLVATSISGSFQQLETMGSKELRSHASEGDFDPGGMAKLMPNKASKWQCHGAEVHGVLCKMSPSLPHLNGGWRQVFEANCISLSYWADGYPETTNLPPSVTDASPLVHSTLSPHLFTSLTASHFNFLSFFLPFHGFFSLYTGPSAPLDAFLLLFGHLGSLHWHHLTPPRPSSTGLALTTYAANTLQTHIRTLLLYATLL